ncbi:hypothetical protein [Pontibacter ramchanderi]|uniref:SpoIIAA-like protein n=1 Tax=Pontibacter ramchanderi TaxID=1179743 RepID=A0A2N3UD57_9BACT|nr:hypothetical protein [Pontibacter ramchanderi]PKV67306.1 hypothetical protein BD749_2448 [Pontibacter ramchanderi]
MDSLMMNIYFQNDVVTLSYDADQLLGVAVWNGFLSSSEFREAVEICLKMMDEHKLLLWLGDNRKLRAIRQADQDWFVEVALPRLVAGTLRRNASVLSDDLFNRMAVEQIIKRADNLGYMALKDFDNVAAAMDWLQEPLPSQASV